ncbi:hypothetical protein VPHK406_0244 [Vibrio phage K406]
MYEVNIFGWSIFEKPEAEVKQSKYLRICKVCGDLLGIPDGVILSETTTKEDLWEDLILMTGCSIFGDYTQVIVPKEEEHRLDFKGRHWLVNTTTLEKVKEDIWQ